MSIAASPLEELVVEALMVAVDGPDLARAMAGRRKGNRSSSSKRELAGVERRLEELAASYGEGEITMREWRVARAALEKRRQALESELSVSQPDVLEGLTAKPGALRRAWPTLDIARQRAILRAVFAAVRILPAEGRGPRFDPARVELPPAF